MHRFNYKKGELFCENVQVEKIAQKIETPFYLYSANTFLDHFRKLQDALREINPLICFSVKSNSNVAVLRLLVKNGAGLDIVSGGELYRARLAGVLPKKVVFAGVGKTDQEIKDAIKWGILYFNVESQPELKRIQQIAKVLKKNVQVAIRINPDVETNTHEFIKTGKKYTKFGIDFETAKLIFKNKNQFPNLDINSIHIHIGSQILSPAPFKKAIKKVLEFVKKNDISIKTLNIGGGLGIIYSLEKPQTAKDFAKLITPLFKNLKLNIILEPGRFISGNSGILVAKVLYKKITPSKNFLVVNTAMNDLIRPSLYDSFHAVMPVSVRGRTKKIKADIVGPICESGDFIAKDRKIFDLDSGDLIAIFGVGAYGFSMSSNYNSRPRCAEVLVNNKDIYIIREAETYRDLISKETFSKITL